MIDFKTSAFLSPTTIITFALLFFSAFMVYQHVQSEPCETACMDKGYAEFRYTSEGKFGYPPEKCFCLNQEEAEHKNSFYLGTKINLEP